MNYLRGAVSAISAPYQYYKELPPLNPSTLTGAIDVIVIRSPDDNGDTELRCSPFHVRFGKWQVLRPGDKKVSVSVNGRPIPYNMKIGEAGEAFFVFETDAEVPQDLITSPILEATKPGQSNQRIQPESQGGRFGAPDSQEDLVPELSLDGASQPTDDDVQMGEEYDGDGEVDDSHVDQSKPHAAGHILKALSPTSLLTGTAAVGKAIVHAVQETERDERDRLKDRVDALQNMRRHRFRASGPGQDTNKGDEVLPDIESEAAQPSEVTEAGGVMIDRAGYHSHQRDATDDTITPETLADDDSMELPRTASPSPEPEAGPSTPRISMTAPFPGTRATSEPPPDEPIAFPTAVSPSKLTLPRPHTPKRLKTTSNLVLPRPAQNTSAPEEEEEYMWEWGAFPQRSPMRERFEHGRERGAAHGMEAALWKAKGKERGYFGEEDVNREELKADEERHWRRSKSVPREVEEGEAHSRESNDDAMGAGEEERRGRTSDVDSYGAGGRLHPERGDATRFMLSIEGRRLMFEVGIVPGIVQRLRGDDGSNWGEVEAALEFAKGKVTWKQFLDDDSIVRHEDLVIRWAEERYITRADASPLMGALIMWRENALRFDGRARSLSPLPEDEAASSADEQPLRRPSSTATAPKTPRKTSAWSRWWGSGRAADERPMMKHAGTAPPGVDAAARSQVVQPAASPAPSTASAPPVREETPPPPTQLARVDEKKFVKTLRLTSDQLKALELKSGANTITFSLSASGVAACTARIFVWDSTDLILISDIDGTITKSDALGHVFTMIGRDWTHLGVAKLYTDICRNGYKIMYLTSRAIGQADSTRDYLKGIKQNDYQLPEGPVIMSPDRLMTSLHREVIMRKPEVFKMACLRDIQRLFGPQAQNPFYAGFGNRITDALSYRSVNVPSSRIFTIDSAGEVKMELLELAGYKSSYIHMTDLVDQMFPPVQRKWQAEFTDFNYWKTPISEFPLPDLSPPSPALSARSDTSNQSTIARIRNLSLMGARPRSFQLPPPAAQAKGDAQAEQRLRQMSSFERLRETLGLASPPGSVRSESPAASSAVLESEEEDADEWAVRRTKRERRTSMESMPGSLPGSEDDEEEDDVEFGVEGEGEYEGDGGEDPADEDLDEDLLAAGEMQNVPYL